MLINVKSHSVELRDYITGRQALELKKMQLQASKLVNFDAVTQSGDIESDLAITVEIQKKALEFLVVSVDGSSEDAFNKVLDFPLGDFEKVMEEVDELRGEKKRTK